MPRVSTRSKPSCWESKPATSCSSRKTAKKSRFHSKNSARPINNSSSHNCRRTREKTRGSKWGRVNNAAAACTTRGVVGKAFHTVLFAVIDAGYRSHPQYTILYQSESSDKHCLFQRASGNSRHEKRPLGGVSRRRWQWRRAANRRQESPPTVLFPGHPLFQAVAHVWPPRLSITGTRAIDFHPLSSRNLV